MTTTANQFLMQTNLDRECQGNNGILWLLVSMLAAAEALGYEVEQTGNVSNDTLAGIRDLLSLAPGQCQALDSLAPRFNEIAELQR